MTDGHMGHAPASSAAAAPPAIVGTTPPGYPATGSGRDRFVRSRRGARPARDPWRHQGVIVEPECNAAGEVETTATLFLTGRECPWHCVMCDLWQYTIAEDTPPGAIPAQIAAALATLADRPEQPTNVKLYNAGSFFDPRAVPPSDDAAIVAQLGGFTRVIVESHPALVSERTWRMRQALGAARPAARLEVAIGLETAHPGALDAINKRVTTDDVGRAARALHAHDVDLRIFLLVRPPFVPGAEQDEWLSRSVRFAFDCGATAVSLIPTRPDEGALREIAAMGAFVPPSLLDVERALVVARAALVGAGRVFVDTWDLDRLAPCPTCAPARRARLVRANLEQRVPGALVCDVCGEVSPS